MVAAAVQTTTAGSITQTYNFPRGLIKRFYTYLNVATINSQRL